MTTEFSAPVMMPSQSVGADWTAFQAFLPVPGLGALAVNAFLLKSAEPVLVDTGPAMLGDAFVEALTDAIDPKDLRWIWLSHTDADHIGNLMRILELAPNATLATSFLSVAKMQLLGLEVDRLHIVQPGDSLAVGDRDLVPVRPPYFDAPETLGFLETKNRTLFAGDCFGALLPRPAERLDAVDAEDLERGMAIWSAIDAPWLAQSDRAALDRCLGDVAALAPDTILSAHLPVSDGPSHTMIDPVRRAWCSETARSADPQSAQAVRLALAA
ncbi:MAG: MBL fold metallo-hydrolase [Alphaproteobacteria bacterium]